MENEKNVKSKSWNAIVYPESLPDNWRELLDELRIQWIESPLHDKDINATGEQKKPHYHLCLIWDGPTTFKNVSTLVKTTLGGVTPQVCHSVRGSVRYMAHLDNPEKYRYNELEIVSHNGADLDELLKPTAAYENSILKEITWFIRDNNITEFVDFATVCLTEHEEWFYLLTSRYTLYIRELLRSQRFKGLSDD